jgi:hypothetical protein
MIFNVIITETRSKTLKIEAQTEGEAISQAEKKIPRRGDYVE